MTTVASQIVETVITTTRANKIVLDGRELVEILRHAGYTQVPINAQVTFTVPGGGDWSNTNIDIDRQCPILVEWTTVEERRPHGQETR